MEWIIILVVVGGLVWFFATRNKNRTPAGPPAAGAAARPVHATVKSPGAAPTLDLGAHQLGPNRKLTTALAPGATLELLESLVESYRPRKYRALQHLTPASAEVPAGAQPPAQFVELKDAANETFFVALWEEGAGSAIGLFSLSAEDLAQTTLIGNWKMRDGSLSSAGSFPPGTIGLRSPQLPSDYITGMLEAAGRDTTAGNVAAATAFMGGSFVLKGTQFIEGGTKRSAASFQARHLDAQSIADLQRILDDLASVPGLVQYVQELPWRNRALFLEDTSSGRLWESLPH